MRFPQLERRLGRGDVDYDNLIELMGIAKLAEVLLNALDGGAGRIGSRDIGPVGELGNGGARVQNGSRPDVLRPGVEVGQTRLNQIVVENVRALLEFADRVAEMRAAE